MRCMGTRNLTRREVMKKMVLVFWILAYGMVTVSAFAEEPKVVVIPLNSSKPPQCTLRMSNEIYLNGYYVNIIQNCLAGETVMTGGFAHSSYHSTHNCRVIMSRPNDTGTGWLVEWTMPSTNECATDSARTYALCCKW
jgi:hypothetical protein